MDSWESKIIILRRFLKKLKTYTNQKGPRFFGPSLRFWI